MTEDSMDVARRVLDVWNSGDLSALDELLAADYVGHVGPSDHNGAELRQRIVAFRSRLPGVRFTFLEQISDGTRLASRLEAAAEVDGREMHLRGINISVIEGGRLSEEWAVWDPAG